MFTIGVKVKNEWSYTSDLHVCLYGYLLPLLYQLCMFFSAPYSRTQVLPNIGIF
jgi:hypothetical protein